MNQTIIPALRLLAHLWLEELKPDDLETISALPELAEALGPPETGCLTDLAVEYQRLFGFNLPPYESVFIDPSAMLMAPATARVQKLYQLADWLPPANPRAGAPDQLGMELLAMADWLEQGQTDLADRLLTQHLALWGPAFIVTLRRLAPHPFYACLGDLTLDLLLAMLPEDPIPNEADPFPDLPPPAKYRATGEEWPQIDPPVTAEQPPSPFDETEETAPSLRQVARRLLVPREAGLFLSRADLAQVSQRLDLPGVMGERQRILESLLRLAGQYDLLPALSEQFGLLLTKADTAYEDLADEYPPWSPYDAAWRQRVASSLTLLDELTSFAQIREISESN
jgi:TorA maturation chaperone TorD